MVLGDNRYEKNLVEGASKCGYSLVILSKHTVESECAMEELSIIESRHNKGEVTIFPVLYELAPDEIPRALKWIKNLIFKEVDRHSGTREICNHVACKITGDFLNKCNFQSMQNIVDVDPVSLPPLTMAILHSYQEIDCANLNSRIALLYATYLSVTHLKPIKTESMVRMATKIFDRLFTETRLNLPVDYRELWLLENSVCILINCYLTSCTESKI